MLSTSKSSMASQVRASYGRPKERRSWVVTLVLALASAAVAGPALGRTAFDGDWSVLIVTHGGPCDPAYRYGVHITDGKVINDAAQSRCKVKSPQRGL